MLRIPMLLAALGLATSISAQTLTGQIVDPNGAPIVGATVYCDFSATIQANTDALGNFTITTAVGLQNQRYDVQVNPRMTTVAPTEIARVQVNGVTSLGTIQLLPAAQITLTMVGPTGLPLLGGNLSAYDSAGVKLYTPNDGTDVNGNAQIVVPLMPIVFRAMPPVGSGLVPFQENIDVTGSRAYGTMTMRNGYAITGSIVRSGATPLPVANCEIVATNLLTGEVVFLATKQTNALGAFSLLLPFGLYRLDLLPANTSPYAARQVFGVPVIDYGYSLGLVRMDLGVALSGTVRNSLGVAVAGADIDVLTSNGHKMFTPKDNTTATGTFSVLVPTGGTYYVEVDPPVVSGLIGGRTAPTTASGATNVGIITLATGVPATIAVTDAIGSAVANAQLSVEDATTGATFIVPGNQAGADGVIHAVVPQGNMVMRVKAPQGSGSAPVVLPAALVSAPIIAAVQLQPKVMFTNLRGLGILSVPNGGEIYLEWTVANQTALVQSFTVEGVVALPSGSDVPWVPPIPLDMPGPIGLMLPFWLAMPPLPANELGFLQKFTVRLRDAATTQLFDEAYVYYVAN